MVWAYVQRRPTNFIDKFNQLKFEGVTVRRRSNNLLAMDQSDKGYGYC